MNTFILSLTLAAALLLSGCNTVRGVGQDIQKAGEKIEGVATKK
jgi:predicted small secreted protein